MLVTNVPSAMFVFCCQGKFYKTSAIAPRRLYLQSQKSSFSSYHHHSLCFHILFTTTSNILSTPVVMTISFKHCNNDVTPSCPLEATLYGYYPSFPWNIVYATIFAICCTGQIFLGIRCKVKSYSWAVGSGCFLEVAGMYPTNKQ